jgi:hypothetical protein
MGKELVICNRGRHGRIRFQFYPTIATYLCNYYPSTSEMTKGGGRNPESALPKTEITPGKMVILGRRRCLEEGVNMV